MVVLLGVADVEFSIIVTAIVWALILLVVRIFFAHLGWYCVVKDGGCCPGTVGNIVWGVIYALMAFGFVLMALVDLVKLADLWLWVNLVDLVWFILFVPTVFMAIGCFQLALRRSKSSDATSGPAPVMYPPNSNV